MHIEEWKTICAIFSEEKNSSVGPMHNCHGGGCGGVPFHLSKAMITWS